MTRFGSPAMVEQWARDDARIVACLAECAQINAETMLRINSQDAKPQEDGKVG